MTSHSICRLCGKSYLAIEPKQDACTPCQIDVTAERPSKLAFQSNEQIARRLVRHIFKIGDDGFAKTTRMAYKCQVGEREIETGGMCEDALKRAVKSWLDSQI